LFPSHDRREPKVGGNFSESGVVQDFSLRANNIVVEKNTIKIVNLGNNVYRVSGVLTASRNSGPQNNSGVLQNSNYSGKAFRIGGMQIEQQSFATSYIPTSGTATTRNKDEANSSGDTSLINTVEGVLYTETACLTDGDNNRAISVALDNNNYASIQYNPTTNRILGRYRNAGNFESQIQFDVTDRTQFSKIAFRYKQDDFALFVNGVKVGTDTSGSVLSADTFTSLNLGTSTTANLFEGKVKTVAVYKEFLTDAQLISLTS